MDYSTLILWRRRGIYIYIFVAWEWEKENHPERGSALLQSLPCEGNSCDSFLGTHSPDCYTRGTAKENWGHCLWRDHSVPEQPLPALHPPLPASQLWGNVTKPALSPAIWPKSLEMQPDKDKTSPKCQLSTTRHSSRSTCDSQNPVPVWHRPPPGHARQFSR